MSDDSTPLFAYSGVIDRIDVDLGDPGLDADERVALHARFDAGEEY